MRKGSLIILSVLLAVASHAQMPVSWHYTAKKIAPKTYEIHLKASIDEGWHLYAQSQSENFIGTPTSILFSHHPLLVFSGKPSEIGDLEIKNEPTLGTEARQYEGAVEFVQKVVVKAEVKTNISGSIKYQVCTDERCMQPTELNFSVSLN